MFTGLVQELGLLRRLGPRLLQVNCQNPVFAHSLAIGDSVAVDGACLTVESCLESGFTVTVSPETLNRTTLESLVDTDWVFNLEPALRVGDRLGGHFVSGHIDGTGRVATLHRSAESWEIHFAVEPSLGRYIVPKGSVAVNGISLTVADCTADGTRFKVAAIPHSFTHTNLQYLAPQSEVNIETDLLGKYVAKLIQGPSADADASPGVTLDFLTEHGFV